MNMKRYTADELHGDLYYTLPDDAVFYSRADLIAAGCLVPVPDREACLAWDSLEHSCVLYDGVLWKVSLDSESTVFMETVDGSRPSLNYVHGAGQPTVQPVRLVPLEEVG